MNEHQEKISIIVPVYNTEKYLRKCVDSLRNQTYENLEILLIDDGSTDGSPLICDQYSKQDARIKTVHQSNQGLSAARNLGIEAASGAYVTFVDSDDYVHHQFIELLYRMLSVENSGVSMCSFQRFVKEEEIGEDEFSFEAFSYKKIDSIQALAVLNEWHTTEAVGMVIVCNKMYRKELFADIRFPLHTWHEDEFIIHRILEKAGSTACTNQPLYFYRQHGESFMGANDQRDNFNHLALHKALISRIDFYKAEGIPLINGAVHHLLRESNSFYDVYLEVRDVRHNEKRRELVRQFRNVYMKYFFDLSVREKLCGGCFAMLPGVYHWLVSKRRKRSKKD